MVVENLGVLKEIVKPKQRGEIMPAVEIYDTTLRDGSQAEGINFQYRIKYKLPKIR